MRRTGMRCDMARLGRRERPIRPAVDADAMLARFVPICRTTAIAPPTVIDELAEAAEPGTHGDGLPAVLRLRDRRRVSRGARRRLARLRVGPEHRFAPAHARDARAVEEVAARWLLELLGLPAGSGVGFVTGATSAQPVGADRWRATRCCANAGHDAGATASRARRAIRFLAGDAVHTSVVLAGRHRRARRAGHGRRATSRAASTSTGWPPRSPRHRRRPTIVALQAGDVHSGAFDDFAAAIDRRAPARARGCTSTARSGCGRRRSPRLAPPVRAALERRRLVGDRRAQDPQRALRLRRRDRPRRSRR